MSDANPKANDPNSMREWWRSTDLAGSVCAVLHRCREGDKARENRIKADLEKYLSRRLGSLNSWSYEASREPTEDGPRLPLAKSVVDTIHAKLVKHLPRSVPVTENATWGLQRQAKALEAFIEGVKYLSGYNALFADIVRDGMTAADGYAWVRGVEVEEGVGAVRIERLHAWQVRVDPFEAAHGKPRSLFIELPMDRRMAAETWPEHASAIMEKARRANASGNVAYHSHADQVRVIVAYHLPSSRTAKDGFEVVVIEGVEKPVAVIARDSEVFPVGRFSWCRPLVGYHGHSLVEEVSGLHVSLNEHDEVIRARMAQSVGFFVNYMGAKVSKNLDNDTGIPIFDIDKTAESGDFVYHSPNLVSSELLSERNQLIDFGYRFPGVSQLSAGGLKPAGLDAAVALREHQDIESERFTLAGEEMENFDLTISRLIIAEAKALHERGLDIEVRKSVKKRRRTVLRKLKWAEVRKLHEDAYELQVFPASQLPRDISGRMALVEQMIAAGFLGREDAMRLIDIPDVEGVLSETLAPYYIVLDLIEDMIEDKKSRSPIPELDLTLTAKITNLAILQASIDEVPEDRIALLRSFASQTQQLQARAAQATAQAQAAAMPAQAGEPFMPNAAGALQPGMATNAVPQGQAAVA